MSDGELNQSPSPAPQPQPVPVLEGPVPDAESHEFLENMKRAMEAFTFRMRGNLARGRPLAADTSLQGLFQTLQQMNAHLTQLTQLNEARRGTHSLCSDDCLW